MGIKVVLFDSITKNKYLCLALIALLSFATWSNSITIEFTGYDDIKLIANNEKIQEGLIPTLEFYATTPSTSNNLAWTNHASLIFRPLEWFGSALGYKFWGARAEYFHLFFNILFHILNSILVFFFLLRLFEKEDKKSLSLALVITAIWTVHPLHNEAINMLTSGVGFLWAHFFALAATVIMLYLGSLRKPGNIALLLLSLVFYFLAFCGSEMTLIFPVLLTLLYAYRRMFFQESLTWLRISLPYFSIAGYMLVRSNIVPASKKLLDMPMQELCERVFVVAPQVFIHYIKLFFYPDVLTIDQHHRVVLAETFEFNHIVALLFVLFLLGALIYLLIQAFKPERALEQRRKLFLIAFSIVLAIMAIAIALNIVPLYCLARERYAYMLTLGLVMALVFVVHHFVYCPQHQKITLMLLLCAVTTLGVRSYIKCNDWKSGESFWYSTVNSIDDIGAKQIWRARLLEYYKDPGTKTFVANQKIKEQIQKDFDEYIDKHKLRDLGVRNQFLSSMYHKPIVDKYGFAGRKTIATSLLMTGEDHLQKEEHKKALRYFILGYKYYPQQFQLNLNMLTVSHKIALDVEDILLDFLYAETVSDPFYAGAFMDTLSRIKHPKFAYYAEKFKALNPKSDIFDVYLFSAYVADDNYNGAYKAVKRMVANGRQDPVFDKFINTYEAGLFSKLEKQ